MVTSVRIGAALGLAVALGGVAGAVAQAPGEPEPEAEPRARIERLEVFDRVETDGTWVRRQRNAARLEDAAAVAAFSQIGVPFFESNQKAEITRLVVTKPDGRELDLAATAPRDVAPLLPPELPIYSDLRILRMAVPSLEPGDRIEFETRVRVEPLAPGEVWFEMSFASVEEADFQLYELDVPEAMPLVVHVRDGLEAKLEESGSEGRRVRRWRIAAKAGSEEAEESDAEAGAPAPEGFEPDIAVTSLESWDELGRWWSGLAPPESGEAVVAKARELTAGLETPRERLAALNRFVSQEIRYLALPLGLGRYRARPATEVLDTGLGDCKDKIRLLASLAGSLGLEVEPVLVPVQRRRRIDAAPSPVPFDHVIARVRLDGEEVWMDPTSEMTPMGSLPAADRGLPGVAVLGPPESARAELVTTPEGLAEAASSRVETTGAIDPSGLIHARVRWTFHGDDEAVRTVFHYGNQEQRRQVVEYMGRAWTTKDNGSVGDFRSGEPRDLTTPFWIEFDAEWEMSASVWAEAWDLWIPLPRIELDEPPDPKQDAEAARRPLELGATPRQQVVARIEVPEGLKVDPPVPVTAERGFATYRSDYRVEGRTLILERSLELKVRELEPGRFEELRALRKLIADDRGQEFDFAAAPQLVPEPEENADDLNGTCLDELDAERWEEAETHCRRAVELDPEHRYAWNNLGRALRHLDRLDESETAFRRQLEIDPNDRWSWANLGLVARDRGDLEEAEKRLRKQIEVAPLEEFGYRQLGHVLELRGRLEEAETMLARALKLDPDNEWTRKELFTLRVRKGGCEPLRAQLSERPEEVVGLSERVFVAVALLQQECRPLAPFEHWFESLREDAEDELATAGVASHEPTDSTARALALVGGLAATWDAAGRIALERGDAQTAERWLEPALKLAPSPSTAMARAEALKSKGDLDGAGLHWAIASALAGEQDAAVRERFEREVPDRAERERFDVRGREASWRLRSFERSVPEAAGVTGSVWLVFEPDGRISSGSSEVDHFPDLFGAVGPDLRMPVPEGNRARILRRAEVSCSAAGKCTFLYEFPFQTAWEVRPGS